MELLYIVIPIMVILGFIALAIAMSSEKRTGQKYHAAKADYERAKKEREQAQANAENNRALTLTHARDNALRLIQTADLESKNALLNKIEERGGLTANISSGNNDEDRGVPRIDWTWQPFENAVLKIYRNEGAIFEDIQTVAEKAFLIHVEQYEPQGFFRDREAKLGKTYNYYIFIETRRIGVRAEPIIESLPSEFQSNKVIDERGNEITSFKTVRPVEFEEPYYFGFRYKRITVERYKDETDQRKHALNHRRQKLELDQEEIELERMERELGLQTGKFDENHIRKLIEEARRITDRDKVIDRTEAILSDIDVTEREREIILAYVRKNAYL